MAGGQLGTVLRQLRSLLGEQAIGLQSDGQLLERFTATRDEAAFATLLQRHGPMVLGVCRRVLGDGPDTEDAFQATFLVLVRRASAIRKQSLLASWLYGVALRTAAKARSTAARRRAHERQASAMLLEQASESEVDRLQLQRVLDEELSRLPEHYRTPLVLCYLEGKTKEEAARELACPAGTVSSRLVRGRDLLRGRLTRRGVTLSAGVLGTLLAKEASAAVPPHLTASTLRAAVLLASKSSTAGIVSASVLQLTEGVLHTMFANQVRFAAALAICLALLLLTGGAATYRVLAGGGDDGVQAGGKPARPDETPRSDHELIQGTWKRVVLSEATGKVLDEETWVFKGERYWRIRRDGSERGPYRFRLDPSKNPKHLDFVYPPMTPFGSLANPFGGPGAASPPGEQIQKCIYELSGDTLKVGLPQPGRATGSGAGTGMGPGAGGGGDAGGPIGPGGGIGPGPTGGGAGPPGGPAPGVPGAPGDVTSGPGGVLPPGGGPIGPGRLPGPGGGSGGGRGGAGGGGAPGLPGGGGASGPGGIGVSGPGYPGGLGGTGAGATPGVGGAGGGMVPDDERPTSFANAQVKVFKRDSVFAVIPLKHLDAITAADAVRAVLGDKTLAQADSRMNAVIVAGTKEQLDQASKLVEQLDNVAAKRSSGPTGMIGGGAGPGTKQLVDVAREEMRLRYQELQAGRGSVEAIASASRRVLDAQNLASDKKEERIAALEAHLKTLREMEDAAKVRYDAGKVSKADQLVFTYLRLEAELLLQREKGK